MKLSNINFKNKRLIQLNTKISIKGKIFFVERSDKFDYMYIFITDYINSYIIKIKYVNYNELLFNLNIWIEVEGFFENDSIMNEIVIKADKIKISTSCDKKDDFPEKRIELKIRSKYNDNDSIVEIEEMIELLKCWNHEYVGIMDKCNIQNFPDFYSISNKFGIKSIFGCEIVVKNEFYDELFPISVIVKNKEGLKNLYKIITHSHMNLFKKIPVIIQGYLNENRKGLFLGCEPYNNFLINGQKHNFLLDKFINWLDFFEFNPLNTLCEKDETKIKIKLFYNQIYKYLLNKNKLCIMTGNVKYIRKQDKKLYDAYKTGNSLKNEIIKISETYNYLRNTEEMIIEGMHIFNKKGIAKNLAIRNPLKLINNIEEFSPFKNGLYVPKIQDEVNILKNKIYKNIHNIYGKNLNIIIKERLEKELNAILNNGYTVIFLISSELVEKSQKDDYPVGSRGSVGSSFVAFLLGITEVNPLPPHYYCKECSYFEISENLNLSGFDLIEKNCPYCKNILKSDGHNLKFEIFMGLDGNKIPDIDINFSGEYQKIIHKYLENRFGKEKCFKAGTINKTAKRGAASIFKKYIVYSKNKFNEAEKMWYWKNFKNIKRNTGQHPSAMIIIPEKYDIHDFSPYQYSANNEKINDFVTHFDFEFLEKNLLKIDALSHDGPTFLKRLKEITGYNYNKIEMNNKLVLKLFSSTEPLNVNLQKINVKIGTLGVPEVWTPFAHRMLEEIKPKTFYDLSRTSSLSHGTNIWFNNARELVVKNIASINQVVSCRDDILLTLEYYGINTKDAFKIMEKVRKGIKLNLKDIEIIKKSKIQEWYIDSLLKIKYLFPKSHAVAYMIMAYKIAYYKLYYPIEFYSVYFSVHARIFDIELIKNESLMIEKIKHLSKFIYKHDFEKFILQAVLKTTYEMKKRGFDFLLPDIKKSHPFNFLIEGKRLRIPLIKIKGLGKKTAEKIYIERENNFLSLADFKKRTGISKVLLEKLIKENFISLPERNEIKLF